MWCPISDLSVKSCSRDSRIFGFGYGVNFLSAFLEISFVAISEAPALLKVLLEGAEAAGKGEH